MPEAQEVFRMATQKVRPDPGALERQQGQQRRSTIRRKAGAYALVAAFVGALAVVAVRAGVDSDEQVPGNQPSSPTTAPGQPVGVVTSDGSTCSLEMTADAIEGGFVAFEVVNDTDERAMFDSWRLSDGYTFRAFETAVERDAQFAEDGQWQRGAFPDIGQEVTLLSSDLIPAHSSDTIVAPMSAGTHAIVCLKPYEGHGLRDFGIVGPIIVR